MPSTKRQSAALAEPQSLLRRRIPLVIAMALSGAAALAFGWRTLDAGFVMGDDQRFVIDHYLVNHPSLENAWTLLTIPHGDLYQPLPMLTFQANHAAAAQTPDGISPFAFHLTNVLLHAINAMLAALLGAALSRRTMLAGLTGILFATHPMAMETVGWVSGRMILLATMFSLIVLILAARRPRTPGHAWRPSLWAAWIASLASKVMPTIPIVAWMFDRVSHRDEPRMPWLIYASMLVVAAVAVAGMSKLTQAEGFASTMSTSVSESVGTLLLATSRYLDQYVVPTRLSPWTPPLQRVDWTDNAIIYAAIKLTLILVMIVALRKRAPIVAVGLLAFVLLLAPFLFASLARRLFVADRYMYLPMIGLHLAVAASLMGIAGRLSSRRTSGHAASNRPAWLAAVPATALAIWWLFIAFNLAPVWRNTITYAERIVACFPDEPDAYNELARALLYSNRAADALAVARSAADRWPDNPRLFAQCAEAQSRLGNHASALADFDKALEATPDHTRTRYLRANTLLALGRIDEAKSAYQALREDQPEFLPVYSALAGIYRHEGNNDDLRKTLQAALKINPFHRDNAFDLAMLDYSDNRLDAAEKSLRRLVERNPNDAPALLNLGAVLARMGRNIEAVRCYDRLLAMNPRQSAARFNRGDLLLSLGQTSDAEQDFRTILKSAPTDLGAATRIHQLLTAERRWQELSALWTSVAKASSSADQTNCYALWAQSLSALDLHDPLPASATSTTAHDSCAAWLTVYVCLRSQDWAGLAGALDRLPDTTAPDNMLENDRRVIMGAFEALPVDIRNTPAGLLVAARLLLYFGDAENAVRFLNVVSNGDPPWSARARASLGRLANNGLQDQPSTP